MRTVLRFERCPLSCHSGFKVVLFPPSTALQDKEAQRHVVILVPVSFQYAFFGRNRESCWVRISQLKFIKLRLLATMQDPITGRPSRYMEFAVLCYAYTLWGNPTSRSCSCSAAERIAFSSLLFTDIFPLWQSLVPWKKRGSIYKQELGSSILLY